LAKASIESFGDQDALEQEALPEHDEISSAADISLGRLHSLMPIIGLASLIPIIVVLIYIAQTGRNVPFWDDWAHLVPIAMKTQSGTLTPADIFDQNVDHRVAFASLLTAILTATTDWNIRVNVLANVFIAVINFALLVSMFRRQQGAIWLLLALPFAALVFSIRQRTNWVWQMETCWHFTLMFLLLMLWTLQKFSRSGRTLVLAAVFTVCMTFSTLHGLLGWPLLFVTAWMLGYRKPRYLAFMLVAGMVCVGLYFTNFDFAVIGADDTGNAAGLMTDPVRLVHYTVTFLGGAFVVHEDEFVLLSTVFGIVGLGLLLLNAGYLLRQTRSFSTIAIWLALAAFSVGSGLLTALGRGRIFPEAIPRQPLLDRYVTASSWLWVGLFALIALTLYHVFRSENRSRWQQALVVVNVAPVLVWSLMYIVANGWAFQLHPLMTATQENCVMNFPIERNVRCLARIYTNHIPQSDVVAGIDWMANERVGTFAGQQQPFERIINLYNVDRGSLGEQVETGFRYQVITNTYWVTALLLTAPALYGFEVQLPQTDSAIVLHTGIYIDRTTLDEATAAQQDGVLFEIRVRTDDGISHPIYEQVIDPTVDILPDLIALDLSEYAGQNVRIIFESNPRENAIYDKALWLDPLITIGADPNVEFFAGF